MSIVKLNETTLKVLSELKEKISNLEKLGSNIDVAWALEAIHHNDTLLSFAEKIKQSVRFDNAEIFLKKDQVRVTIDSVKKQQRAIQILQNHGEKIWDDEIAMKFSKTKINLCFDKQNEGGLLDWWVMGDLGSDYWKGLIEISLDQLEYILTNQTNE